VAEALSRVAEVQSRVAEAQKRAKEGLYASGRRFAYLIRNIGPPRRFALVFRVGFVKLLRRGDFRTVFYRYIFFGYVTVSVADP
jgi:hypothetical protein